MKVYELVYPTCIHGCGKCQQTALVKANNEEQALEIGRKLITDNIGELKDIKVLRERETLN